MPLFVVSMYHVLLCQTASVPHCVMSCVGRPVCQNCVMLKCTNHILLLCDAGVCCFVTDEGEIVLSPSSLLASRRLRKCSVPSARWYLPVI